MLRVEIADNPRALEKGLMFRKELEEDAGMLFKFQSPQVMNFWGLNTYIPLDIAFVDLDDNIVKISRIAPLDLSAVSSEERCVIAIEANEGFFKENNISVGHRIRVDDEGESSVVVFEE